MLYRQTKSVVQLYHFHLPTKYYNRSFPQCHEAFLLIYNDEKDLEDIFTKIVDDEFEPLMRFMKDNMSEFKKSIHPDKICEYISEIINNKS